MKPERGLCLVLQVETDVFLHSAIIIFSLFGDVNDKFPVGGFSAHDIVVSFASLEQETIFQLGQKLVNCLFVSSYIT